LLGGKQKLYKQANSLHFFNRGTCYFSLFTLVTLVSECINQLMMMIAICECDCIEN